MHNSGISSHLAPAAQNSRPANSGADLAPGARKLNRRRGARADEGVAWPSLKMIGLPGDQRAARRMGIGGSDANILLSVTKTISCNCGA